MSTNHRLRVRSSLTVGAAAIALSLTACSSNVEGDVSEGMGNATPLPAAKTSTKSAQLPGTVHELPEHVTSAVAVGENILARAGDKVFSGSAAKPMSEKLSVDNACGDLATAGSSAVLPCPDGIHVISARAGDTAVVGRGTAYSAAVGLSDGRIIGHRANSKKLDVFGKDGELASQFDASRNGSQLVPALKANGGDITNLIEVNRSETSVHEVLLDSESAANGLRAGIGVGPAAAAADGTIAAVDTKGNQLLIYTATDIIRLHQAAPVPQGPWGITIDNGRKLAWVTSTVDGVLTGWDYSSGTPMKVAEAKTVSDPQAVVMTDAGELVVFSASGDGAQVFSPADVDKALAEHKEKSETEAKDMKPRKPANNLPSGNKPSVTPEEAKN